MRMPGNKLIKYWRNLILLSTKLFTNLLFLCLIGHFVLTIVAKKGLLLVPFVSRKLEFQFGKWMLN